MIAPTWFLLAVIILLSILGLVNILSHLMPENALRFFFKEILFPAVVIGLIYIALGA